MSRSAASQHFVDQVHALAVHTLAIHTLAIKATPPAYTRLVRDLHSLLADGFAGDIEAPVRAALDEMAAVFDRHPTNKRDREAAAKAILRTLATRIEGAGASLPEERVEALGSSLASAYLLGLKETAGPLGFQVDFSLPDADAIAGLHDSGLYWIGKFYGEHWTSTTLLDEVRRVMLTDGLGRVEGGRALAKALAAPPWRLVVLDGRTAVAALRPSHWHVVPPPTGALDEQLPFDLWLAYDTSVRGRVRARLHPIEGLPAVIRWDMRTAMGYSAAGRRDGAWGARFRPPTLRLVHLRALRRLDALDEATIRRGVTLGDLPLDQAAELHGTLITRREVLRGQLHALANG